MTDALDRLVAEAERLPFVRLVALLESLLACQVGTTAADEQLLLGHDASLGFHPRDVLHAQRDDLPDGGPPRVRVVTSFAGLTGSVSPLPTPLLEAHARDEAVPDARVLLDAVHHRLLSLLYRGMRAIEPPTLETGAQARALVLALAGLAPSPSDEPARCEALRLVLAPLLVAHPPTPARLRAGVSTLLQDLRAPPQVAVRELRGGLVPLGPSTSALLGRDARLGETSALGTCAHAPTSAIELILDEVALEDFEALTPGGTRWRALQYVVKALTPSEIDVVLELRPERAPAHPLGHGGRLGRGWLGHDVPPSPARFQL